jgi:hypothetical protein
MTTTTILPVSLLLARALAGQDLARLTVSRNVDHWVLTNGTAKTVTAVVCRTRPGPLLFFTPPQTADAEEWEHMSLAPGQAQKLRGGDAQAAPQILAVIFGDGSVAGKAITDDGRDIVQFILDWRKGERRGFDHWSRLLADDPQTALAHAVRETSAASPVAPVAWDAQAEWSVTNQMRDRLLELSGRTPEEIVAGMRQFVAGALADADAASNRRAQ